MDYVCRAVCGMLCADEACIVSPSLQGLAKMIERSYRRGLPSLRFNRVGEEDSDHVHAPPRTPRTMVRVEAARQIYKQVQQSFTYLGGDVTETPDKSVEIVRRTRACWMRIRRYLRGELYDQPKVALSLKTRKVKAEAIIETLLYGCSTWTLRQEHYAKLRTVHHRVLLRTDGVHCRESAGTGPVNLKVVPNESAALACHHGPIRAVLDLK